MTHYDHATAMAFELDRWSKGRLPKSYEREAIAVAQRREDRMKREAAACLQQHRRTKRNKLRTLTRRWVAMFRSCRFINTLDTP